MIIFFWLLRTPSLISKVQKENIICTIDDVRGDVLGPRFTDNKNIVLWKKDHCHHENISV